MDREMIQVEIIIVCESFTFRMKDNFGFGAFLQHFLFFFVFNGNNFYQTMIEKGMIFNLKAIHLLFLTSPHSTGQKAFDVNPKIFPDKIRIHRNCIS